MHVCRGTTLTVSVIELHSTIEGSSDRNSLARGDYAWSATTFLSNDDKKTYQLPKTWARP